MNGDTEAHRPSADTRAAVYAMAVASVYIVGGLGYVLLTGWISARAAGSATTLIQFGGLSGAAFVVLTGGALCWFSHRMFRRAHRESEALTQARTALLLSERRATLGVLSHTVVRDCSDLLVVAGMNIAMLAHNLQPRLSIKERALIKGLTEIVDRLAMELETLERTGLQSVFDRWVSLDLNAFVRESLAGIRALEQVRPVRLEYECVQNVVVGGCPDLLHDSLYNMVLNAAEAAGPGGTVRVRVAADRGVGIVEVHDSGRGVPEEHAPHIFESYYSTKPDRPGVGLLSVKTCADLHCGQVELLPSELGGACFRLRLYEPALPMAA